LDFRPADWRPPPAPTLSGDFAVNHKLASAERLEAGGVGPEDVVVDANGIVYAGLEDGRIVRFPPSGGAADVIANTGGRPLGIELDDDGGLVICDAYKGLLRLSDRGTLQTLVDTFEGERLLFTNNATVAGDGTIYFTDSSRRYSIARYKLEILEHSGSGRLFAHRPDGQTDLLLDGLQFANGVALGPDEEFLLVVETGTYSIRKLWLAGTRAGQHETFVDNLPGFPDNLSHYEGTFWVAIPSLRDRMLDKMFPRPWLRKIVAHLPESLHPRLQRHGFTLGLDTSGRVVHNLQDASGRVAVVTGVRQHGSKLYLGSLTDTAITVYDLTA
jgi:sugar lactone lactonase YvrE